eukprot:3940405-Rhodomonas_salina.1
MRFPVFDFGVSRSLTDLDFVWQQLHLVHFLHLVAPHPMSVQNRATSTRSGHHTLPSPSTTVQRLPTAFAICRGVHSGWQPVTCGTQIVYGGLRCQ